MQMIYWLDAEGEMQLSQVYEEYGRAMQKAQSLERMLLTVLQVGMALNKKFASLDENESRLAVNSKSGMRTMVKGVRENDRDLELPELFDECVELRNRLAHQFYWEHWEDEGTTEGRAQMIEESQAAQLKFVTAAEWLRPLLLRQLDQLAAAPDEFLPGLDAAAKEILATLT